jgi:hypothetical protein
VLLVLKLKWAIMIMGKSCYSEINHDPSTRPFCVFVLGGDEKGGPVGDGVAGGDEQINEKKQRDEHELQPQRNGWRR